MSGLEGCAPHPPSATVQETCQDTLVHKEKEHIRQPSHVSSCSEHSPGMRASRFPLSLPGFLCFNLWWLNVNDKKKSPSRETKTQACPALCGVSNQHQAGSVVEVELRVARVAWHGFLSRD